MAVREVLRLGDPRLRQLARSVDDPTSAAITALIDDLRDTMAARDGAGLAAPQIAVPLRVVIYGNNGPNPRYPEAPVLAQTVLINPRITPIGPERQLGEEGCLSVPGRRELVERWQRIRCSYLNPQGRRQTLDAEGFHARVIQHECDHLDGILFPDRLADPMTAQDGFDSGLPDDVGG
jgi:peptide deformylase